MVETVEEAKKVKQSAKAVKRPPALAPATHAAVAATTIAEKVIRLRQHLHPLGLLFPPGYARLHRSQQKPVPKPCSNTCTEPVPNTVHQTSLPPNRSQAQMAILTEANID